MILEAVVRVLEPDRRQYALHLAKYRALSLKDIQIDSLDK